MDEQLKRRPTKRKPQTFRLGDTVRILAGPFVSFTGEIEGINQAKALLKVQGWRQMFCVNDRLLFRVGCFLS